MKTYDIILDGIITSVSCISIVPPNGVVITNGDSKIAEVAHLPQETEYGMKRVPIIPGSTLRGRIRRNLLKVALAHLETKPSLGNYLYNAVGGVKSAGKEDAFSIVDRNNRRARNPIIGLVGAGDPWDAGTLAIGNAVPLKPIEAHTMGGVRPDDFVRDQSTFDILDKSAVPEYLLRRSNTKATAEASAKVTELLSKLKREKDAEKRAIIEADLIIARSAEKEAKETSGVSLQLPFAHRVLPPNVDMAQKILLLGVTEIEAGLFFRALTNMFEYYPLIGGKSRALAYGEIKARWNATIRPTMGKFEHLGEIEAKAFSEIQYGDRIQDFISSWNAFAISPAFDISQPEKAAMKKGTTSASEDA